MWAQMILKKVHTFIIKPLECMSAAAKDRIALFSRLNIKCRSTAILEPTKNKCEERLLVASSVERNGIPSVFPKDSSATAVRRSSIWSREKEYLRVFSSGGGRTHTCTEHNFFRHFLRFFRSISSYTLIHDITFLGSGTTSWATWLDHNPLDRIRNSSDVPMKKCKKISTKRKRKC